MRRVSITLAVVAVAEEYQTYEGKTCWNGHGAVEIDSDNTAPQGLSEDSCKARCDDDAQCDCVAFEPSIGKCWKRKQCVPGQFGPDGNFNTFVKTHSPAPTPSPAPGPTPSPTPSPTGYTEYKSKTAYYGHGGTEIDDESSAPTGMSVASCEARCDEDGSCDCVSLRPSDGKCWKRKDCVPSQFGNDGNFNTYVKAGTPSPPAPPTPGGGLCPGSDIVGPSGDWVWSSSADKSHSCSSPAVQNNAQMCSGDPTSIVLQATRGTPQCLQARMPGCEFNLKDLSRMDFDISMNDCKGTWAAPLWISPHHWEGGGKSGEIDMLENCPSDVLASNFAGGGSIKRWNVDPNSMSGHVTLWNSGDIKVKLCADSEVQSDGTCPGGGEAFYPNIYGANGCKKGDCVYQFISDIWNGNSGDDGYKSCAKGHPHLDAACSFSIRNIRLQAKPGTFQGKCAALTNSGTSAQETVVV